MTIAQPKDMIDIRMIKILSSEDILAEALSEMTWSTLAYVSSSHSH